MTVLPGKRLSLQSHTGRAELWIVIDDGAVVQIGESLTVCKLARKSGFPSIEKHRLTCTGDKPVRVLEVAFGNWQQADITRYEDDFQRPASGEGKNYEPLGPHPKTVISPLSHCDVRFIVLETQRIIPAIAGRRVGRNMEIAEGKMDALPTAFDRHGGGPGIGLPGPSGVY